MRKRKRPPSRMRFTAAGAEHTIQHCGCLKGEGAAAVRAQIEGMGTPPPAPTGRNKPCPCGSGGKYKQCCGWHLEPRDTRPERRYWPPGNGVTEPEGPASEPPPPSEGAQRRRHRIVELEERKARVIARVDAILDGERRRDEASRLTRKARDLEARARAGAVDAAALRSVATENRARAAELRREAAAIRARVRKERT